MHYGIHYLTIEGDKNEGLKYLGRAQIVVDRLQRRLELGGLSSGSDWERLSDDAYMYARVAMGVNAVRIVVPSLAPELIKVIPEDVGPPDWLSGVVTPGQLKDGVALSYWPTQESQRKFKLSAGLQPSARLAVKGDSEITTVQDTEFRQFTQHAGVKPTMYSGLMRGVVQLLLGYGVKVGGIYQDRTWKVDLGKLPEVEIPLSEYEKRVVKDGYRVLYDYRPFRTHGVIRGPDGTMWLLEISATRGVVAMQLPLHKDSVTEDFAREIEKRGDAEAQYVLDMLGGFPTGESLPQGGNFSALERSGRIVRMAEQSDLSGPFKLSFYGSALGWSINDAGTEAHYTGYEYENGYQYGEHWQINLSIGALAAIKPPDRADDVRRHVAGRGQGDTYIINLEKVDRITNEQAESLLAMRGDEAYDSLDKMQAQSVAIGKASVGRASRGDLYWPTLRAATQYKVWEPMLEGGAIMTHDMRAMREHVGDPPMTCDTTVLAFFVGNELKTGKFFYDRRTTEAESESDFEDCMYIGSWTQTLRFGNISTTPGFYMDDMDERLEVPDSESTTEITGQDLGYSQVAISDHLDDIRIADFWRVKRFKMRTETRTNKSINLASALIVPGFARDACYMATRTTKTEGAHSIAYGYKHLRDPNWAQTWRAIISTAGWSVDLIPECGNKDKRRVRFIIYDQTACSDYADSGQWLAKCDIADNKTYYIPEPPLPPLFIENPAPVSVYKIKLISAYGDIVTLQSQKESWFVASPSPDLGDLQYMWVTGNCLGDTESVVYTTEPNAGLAVSGRNLFEALDDTVPCFIGVV